LDSRFLYPVFLLFLLWTGSTLSYLWKLNNRIINIVIIGAVIVLSIPNIAWTINFVDSQHRLISDPLGTFIDQKNETEKINHFQIVLPIAGNWLNNNGDSSQVIISPYKELAFMLKDKKVFAMTRTIPISSFNQVVQDYNVGYVVSKKDSYGWRDYEIQFGFNEHYDFTLMFDSGAVEIYKILPKSDSSSGSVKFSALIATMKKSDFRGADEYFWKNKSLVNSHADLLYLNVINKHNQGQLDSVGILLEGLYAKPQGLSYTRLAAIHQTLIERRGLLDRTPFSEYRSNILMNLGITYWQIDMKNLSLKYYQQCIDEDSTAALAYVYKIIFSIEERDTVTALKTYQRMRAVFPTAELTEKMDSLMDFHAQYRKANSSKGKAEAIEGIFDMYQFLGFTSTALNIGKKGIILDPSRFSLNKKLGLLYERETEFYPALENLKIFASRNSNDSLVTFKISDLKRKLYIAQ
jgi:tetratricopeptide (TPR) repeat protein